MRTRPASVQSPAPPPVYPFTAIVGQEEMKLALLLCAIAPSLGGVLIMGERGTGKSTAVRALAGLLPPLSRVRGCAYGCDPGEVESLCADCRARLAAGERLVRERAGVPVVDLPLGATEDRVCGTLDVERALAQGVRTFEPGLLARAHRGFLYIDEVNLLEDHLVDLLLDAAATGQNRIEREGISIVHPSRFVLVGSGNPEEGELRPQLLDRFGLYTEVRTVSDVEQRVEIVERREAFERVPKEFLQDCAPEETRLRRRLVRAQRAAASVKVPRALLRLVAELCVRLGVDGHRGELTITRGARALAAFEGRREATPEDVRRVAPLALRHRLRRDPLEQTSGGSRVNQALEEIFGAASPHDDASAAAARQHRDKNSGTGGAGTGGDAQASRKRHSATARQPDSGRHADTETSQEHGADAHAKGDTGAQEKSGAGAQTSPRGREGSARDSRGRERDAPPFEASMPDIVSVAQRGKMKHGAAKAKSGSRGVGAASRSASQPGGGRYTRAVARKPSVARIAFDATLRAAAPMQKERRDKAEGNEALAARNEARRSAAAGHTAQASRLQLASEDLRFKQLRRKNGTLFILAVDTSGSMALNRINQAKGALAGLLRRSYVKRDRVALITFRQRTATLLLAPSQSAARAKRLLDALPVGGATPLSAALLRALEVARRALRLGETEILLLVFTDGRANVALSADASEDRAALRGRIAVELEQLGAALHAVGVSSVVVDTQNRFTSGGEAQRVADALRGRHVHLSSMPATARG